MGVKEYFRLHTIVQEERCQSPEPYLVLLLENIQPPSARMLSLSELPGLPWEVSEVPCPPSPLLNWEPSPSQLPWSGPSVPRMPWTRSTWEQSSREAWARPQTDKQLCLLAFQPLSPAPLSTRFVPAARRASCRRPS